MKRKTVATATGPSPQGNSSTNTSANTKRKRKSYTHQKQAPIASTKITGDGVRSNNGPAIFDGLLLAVSTLESSNNNNNNNNKRVTTSQPHFDESIQATGSSTIATSTPCVDKDVSENESIAPATNYNNYKSLTSLLISHGATLSSQVHSRVHYLIATPHAVLRQTQRVRHAWRRHVDVVDVSWVKACVESNKKVCVTEYLRENDWKKTFLMERTNEQKEGHGSDSDNKLRKGDENRKDCTVVSSWSTPIQLDCCCVCHDSEKEENDCPWCTECNLSTWARQNTKTVTKPSSS